MVEGHQSRDLETVFVENDDGCVPGEVIGRSAQVSFD